MELHSWTICCLTAQIPTTLLANRHNSERCRTAGTGPKSILTIIYIMIKLPLTYRTNCWNNTVDFILLRMHRSVSVTVYLHIYCILHTVYLHIYCILHTVYLHIYCILHTVYLHIQWNLRKWTLPITETSTMRTIVRDPKLFPIL